ncbi:MAG: endonuclease/exonuclease/phosphatase family protein [Treponema sp.]|nr:endonuclease/exonuclease/phosphatase family protein [Treponema sp.]
MPLVFLLCHWKSKLGGDDATEAQRRASARVVQRRLREINASEPGTPVIVMGDLNENHDEFSRRLAFSALLPDDPFAAAMAINAGALDDFLVLSGEKPPVASHFQHKVPAFYSPWENELEGGSYYYRGQWETIDHFLLSDSLFNRPGWVYSGCEIINQTPFVKADGIPNAYNPRNGLGLSDHLPIMLHLRHVE